MPDILLEVLGLGLDFSLVPCFLREDAEKEILVDAYV